jgi:hypothetical protein
MSRRIVRQSVRHSSIRSVAQLLARGYAFQSGESHFSANHTSLHGTMRFVKEAPPIPIEQTEEFRRAPRSAQRAVWGCRIDGRVLDEVVIPFHARLTFGRLRARRASESF